MKFTVHCTAVERVPHPGPILALASIRIDADGEPVATLHGLKVIKGRIEPRIALPDRFVGGRWKAVVELHGEELQRAAVDSVVRELSRATLAGAAHGV